MGIKDNPVTLPPDPIQTIPVYSDALAAFEKLPEVRVLFDNGAGSWPPGPQFPGDPYPGFEHSFAGVPAPYTTARYWYLGPGGALASGPPRREGINWYISNPKALPPTDYGQNTSTGGLWGDASEWQWNWKRNPAGTAVSFITRPLKSDAVVLGAGAIRVWVKSSTRDVDLQATVSEVRPDGKETFVQNGWIRGSERKLSTTADNMFKQQSTAIAPIPTFKSADAKPMPRDRFVEVWIPLYYEGHAYRAGSRIRIVIAAPNGTQPIWSFSQPKPAGKAKVWIAFSKKMPSALILPVVGGVSVPTGLPSCPGLRNEPCRTYVPFTNHTARVSSTHRRKRSKHGTHARRRRAPARFTG
jgi:predicted acyl esterase